MKRKVFKYLSVCLAIAALLPAFALIGCTDKEEKERELNHIEKYIVGTWKNKPEKNMYNEGLVFKSDRTVQSIDPNNNDKVTNNLGTFEVDLNADGTDDELGHYYVVAISKDGSKLAFFNSQPDRLYYFDRDGTTILKTDDSYIYYRVTETEEE